MLYAQVVAVSEEGLALVSCPCVIQEYINHNGKLFKVYVIDDEVMVFQRPSLPNLTPKQDQLMAAADMPHSPLPKPSLKLKSKSLAFDSRYAYPTFEDFHERNKSASDQTLVDLALLDRISSPPKDILKSPLYPSSCDIKKKPHDSILSEWAGTVIT